MSTITKFLIVKQIKQNATQQKRTATLTALR